jgi:hypothetical protein
VIGTYEEIRELPNKGAQRGSIVTYRSHDLHRVHDHARCHAPDQILGQFFHNPGFTISPILFLSYLTFF